MKTVLRIVVDGVALWGAVMAVAVAQAQGKPNIVIMMVDDMGFSDIGCYGGEVETPQLDGLAEGGLRFTQFYNTGRCCPTRASLLTGLYPHQAGLGHMTGDKGVPGYEGYLTERCATIAEVLRRAGYRTLFTGKWHVGSAREHWPDRRGFDRVYGIPEGGGGFFRLPENRTLVLDGASIEPPDDWYTTDAWTDYAMEFIDEAAEMETPFFLYLAHNAPHWPLQAFPEDVQKYRGKYRDGWDAVRAARYSRQEKMGLIRGEWPMTSRDERVPEWESLDEAKRDELDLMMATYAAMIDRVDQNIGRLVAKLQELGVYENTLFLFLADNGGCAEGGTLGSNNKQPIGSPDSFPKYGVCWANASNTPFREYKHRVHEGGIATPLVAHWPAGIEEELRGKFIEAQGHVVDLMATCVDVSGASYPGDKLPLEGESLDPVFKTGAREGPEMIFWEHEGNKAVRHGKWKLVAKYQQGWELYDMEADRTETKNLIEEQPEIAENLQEAYRQWARRALVHPWKEFQKKGKKKKEK